MGHDSVCILDYVAPEALSELSSLVEQTQLVSNLGNFEDISVRETSAGLSHALAAGKRLVIPKQRPIYNRIGG
ncbi:hypothetical protein TGAMA5MH_09494 [Trichoderma gamsii]|uniref:Uncharacterized protein n=1 Tax=Trichoderma gamsii TaxID=398673 RepID=A0A2K0SZC0_9HYPO|nr:hypothetical protein TGAMA5MH_09494 [Trichoderma gamsii]